MYLSTAEGEQVQLVAGERPMGPRQLCGPWLCTRGEDRDWTESPEDWGFRDAPSSGVH